MRPGSRWKQRSSYTSWITENREKKQGAQMCTLLYISVAFANNYFSYNLD